jgi:hypothetical protein
MLWFWCWFEIQDDPNTLDAELQIYFHCLHKSDEVTVMKMNDSGLFYRYVYHSFWYCITKNKYLQTSHYQK